MVRDTAQPDGEALLDEWLAAGQGAPPVRFSSLFPYTRDVLCVPPPRTKSADTVYERGKTSGEIAVELKFPSSSPR